MYNRPADFLRLEKRTEQDMIEIQYEHKRESEYIPKYILCVVNLKKTKSKSI